MVRSQLTHAPTYHRERLLSLCVVPSVSSAASVSPRVYASLSLCARLSHSPPPPTHPMAPHSPEPIDGVPTAGSPLLPKHCASCSNRYSVAGSARNCSVFCLRCSTPECLSPCYHTHAALLCACGRHTTGSHRRLAPPSDTSTARPSKEGVGPLRCGARVAGSRTAGARGQRATSCPSSPVSVSREVLVRGRKVRLPSNVV